MTALITTLAEELGNRLLRLDADTLERLGTLHGKTISLEVQSGDAAPLRVYIFPSEAGVRLRTDCAGAPDVTIAGDTALFARLFRGGAQPVAGELKISGDIELGQRFQRIIEGIDIDWEEQVAHYIGDVPAHALGNVVRDLRAWTAHAADSFGFAITEYLHEEALVLAKRPRVQVFVGAVDRLRADVDRLEQRVRRLVERS